MERSERQPRLRLDALRFEHQHPLGGGANHVEKRRLAGAGLADHHDGAAVPNAGVAEQTQQALLLARTAMERRGYLD